MAKDFIAIDPKKKVEEFSEKGITSLKDLHRIQKKQAGSMDTSHN